MEHERRLATLSEYELLDRLGNLVRRDRHNTAHLLATIAEIDRRTLWAKHACPSMFAFCVERFHMSESVTAKRIWAARTARRYPLIFSMVARGELTLSAIQMLSTHLTQDNHRAVLTRAKHKRTRDIEHLVAELAPEPDVPSRLRALPRRSRAENASAPEPAAVSNASGADARAIERGSFVASDPCTSASASNAINGTATTSSPTEHGASAELTGVESIGTRQRNHQLVALSPRRYKLEVTIDQETHDKLRALQDLMSHGSQGVDPAVIVSKAIDRLLHETLKAKAAVGSSKHRSGRCTANSKHKQRTRSIPAAVRRQVWQRDRGRCTFVDSRGRRCRATRAIQYHHETPYARGGEHKESNITLRCRAHNQYQADLDFGRGFMRAKRGRDGQDSARNVRSPSVAPLPSPLPIA